MQVHLKTQFNGITEAQTAALRLIATDGCVARDSHNFWFSTSATQEEIEALCTAHFLTLVE